MEIDLEQIDDGGGGGIGACNVNLFFHILNYADLNGVIDIEIGLFFSHCNRLARVRTRNNLFFYFVSIFIIHLKVGKRGY